jgi:heme oxygenase (biliverdin-producing, ferredoxin)
MTAALATSTLSARLRADTRELHVAVERRPFVQALLRGALERPAYCALLRNLHAIYEALEAGLARNAGHPVVAAVVLPAVLRTARLAADLDALHGAGWHEHYVAHASTTAYVARLHSLADTAPELLVAHAYVRYLGDLSGGQLLARVVAATLGEGARDVTSFYEFGGRDAARALAETLRARIAGLALGEAGEAAVVAEACAAFERHRALFDELAAAWPEAGAASVSPSP